MTPGRAGEFHPHPPTEPDVNVSAHPARLIQTEVKATDRALRERILPEDRLSKSATLDEVPPSLRSHYRTFNTTTRYSVPVPRIGTQALVGPPTCAAPFASGRQVPTFRTRAWIKVTPPVRRTPPGP